MLFEWKHGSLRHPENLTKLRVDKCVYSLTQIPERVVRKPSFNFAKSYFFTGSSEKPWPRSNTFLWMCSKVFNHCFTFPERLVNICIKMAVHFLYQENSIVPKLLKTLRNWNMCNIQKKISGSKSVTNGKKHTRWGKIQHTIVIMKK